MPRISESQRFPWVDAVRGSCVLAVVLLHFCLAAFYPHMWGTKTVDVWAALNSFMTSIRMPTLFAISGFLLSSRIRRGWADPRTRFSALHAYYLYVVWLIVYALLAIWFPTGARPLTNAGGWMDLAEQLVNPHTMLWFVLGLAFWTAVLATARSLPIWLVLPALFALTVATFMIEWSTQLDFYIRILRYGFYIGVGVYLRPAIERLINQRVWWTVAASSALYVAFRVLTPIEESLGLPFSIFIPLRDLAAVGVAMSLVSVLVAYVKPIRIALGWVGERTLPIYVLHSLVIWSLVKIPGWASTVGLPVYKYVVPGIWTVIVALVCIAIYKLAMLTPLRYLFDMPKKWRDVLRKERHAARSR